MRKKAARTRRRVDPAAEKRLRIKFISELLSLVLAHIRSKHHIRPRKIAALKTLLCRKYRLTSEPKTTEILAAIPPSQRSLLLPYLRAKPVRTASGIAIIAVMCKPHRCPHVALTGTTCIYCPGGPDSDFEYSSQSYTGKEPTSLRAIRSRYNPYLQVRNRLDQLKRLGHDVTKVEFIVMGGTFLSLDSVYREFFIRNLHDGLSGHCSESVSESVRFSQESRVKCIGITIETRPDYATKKHLVEMLRYGTTRLEIGVQSVYQDVVRDTNRGHSMEAVTRCLRESKDAGFKVICHMMPNLPKVDLERDLLQFRELFENPLFRPDGLKIYPTLVIRGTGLYELWKTGQYKNYPPAVLVDLIAKILALVPPWTRIYRIQRDIPMPIVTSGVEKGNIRQLALERVRDLGLVTKEVRTREVGIRQIHQKISPDEVELLRRDYVANGGWETFLSYEDPKNDILIGLLRLRKLEQKDAFVEELMGVPTSMVRELHVYGSVVPVSAHDPSKFQHQGYGTLLMEEAERIAREEHGSLKMSVISGVGVRKYYYRLGYELDGPYVSKML